MEQIHVIWNVYEDKDEYDDDKFDQKSSTESLES